MRLTARDLIPPLLLLAALLVWASGALDRAGFEGVGQGVLVGATICAPIWLLGLYRRRRMPDKSFD